MTDTNDGVVVTLKAGTGYDAPWIVLRGSTVQEVADLLGAAEGSGLYALVGAAKASFIGQASAGSTLGATPVAAATAYVGEQAQPYQQSAPAPAANPEKGPQPIPPGVTAPTCPHGPPAKALIKGQYGLFWACPERDRSKSCKPEKFKG